LGQYRDYQKICYIENGIKEFTVSIERVIYDDFTIYGELLNGKGSTLVVTVGNTITEYDIDSIRSASRSFTSDNLCYEESIVLNVHHKDAVLRELKNQAGKPIFKFNKS